MTIAVIRFPGSNCDQDAGHVLSEVLGCPVEYVWHRRTTLPAVDAVVLPGGFSYGDYLRSGAMAALSPIMEDVVAFAHRGGPVVGICNGFQILTERGLLPGQLARNRDLHFICRVVSVRVERTDLAFTAGYSPHQVLRLPIAHNEGRYYLGADELERVEGEGRVVFRYCAADGTVDANDPASNPNGSLEAIAGLVNARGNVLGLMPHPERASEAVLGSDDGRALFVSLLDAVAGRTPA